MTAIVSENGKLLAIVQGNTETIELNTPINCIAVDDPPSENMYYDNNDWVQLPEKPSIYHDFDYNQKLWIDHRTLTQVQDHHWMKLKLTRDSKEFGGFEFQGHIYDSDINSQGRIITASQLGMSVEWTTADNAVVTLNAIELSGLVNALASHVASVHERGRVARQEIYAASSIQEVEAIQF